MKRVLVTGANGQLGLALQAAQNAYPTLDIVFVGKKELDITDPNALQTYFAKHRFEVCINTAAYTNVDAAEKDKDAAFALNATAVKQLGHVCRDANTWLVHLSTDYVFDGALDRPYTPADNPNPVNVYGASKLAGEQAIHAVSGTYSIVRTSWLYSQYGNNFYTKLLSQVNAGKTLQVTSDQKGCPTRAEELAAHLLTGIANQQLPIGISHYCGNEIMTWLDLARRLFPKQKVLEWNGASSPTTRPKKVVLKK
ncbi:MAG: dTDP-4-dehydrorhamnose reductase [Flavobacteriaceae bacterium]|nr:dTDP-4-dehydrorhamnose reductase [Flavobacteriaceae bacterium]